MRPSRKNPAVGTTDLAEDPRWAVVLNRQESDAFVYAVKTTGIYCRSSCSSRRPLPQNVEFYDTTSAAERAGYRACRRCSPDRDPDQPGTREVAKMCALIHERSESPSLRELAKEVGFSESHAQRTFKKLTGLTPHQYRDAILRERLGSELTSEQSVTRAMYATGFSSSGRFYERARPLLGMSPGQRRAAGKGLSIRFAVGQCSLGAVLVAATARGVCAVSLGEDPERLVFELEDRFSQAELLGADAEFERTVAAVVGRIEAVPGLAPELPLDVRGTVFQQRVWQALRAIPAGTMRTYTDVATMIGDPRSTRAVARACASNPVAVLIPCHRVVRRDGALAGYRWGVERKQELLRREGAKHGRST